MGTENASVEFSTKRRLCIVRYETPELVELGSINDCTFAVQGELTGLSPGLQPQEGIPGAWLEVEKWDGDPKSLGGWWAK